MESRNNFERMPNESLEDYLVFLFQEKERFELNSQKISDIMNREANTCYSESKWRKQARGLINGMEMYRDRYADEDLAQEIIELKKERYKLSEQRAAYNNIIREQAKVESFKEFFRETMQDIPAIDFGIGGILPKYSGINGTLVAVLSDLHFGLNYSYLKDSYSIDIANKRMIEYAYTVKSQQNRFNAKNLVVMLAGDLVNGIISPSVKASNREEVIDQIKYASESIAQFVVHVNNVFDNIDIVGVAGNHSRINPNKNESTLGEYMDDIVLWYLKSRLACFDNVNVIERDVHDGIAEYYLGESKKHVVIVHGNYDTLDNGSIGKLQRMTGDNIDVIVTGHLHENFFADCQGVHVIRGGCMCGSGDDYCRGKRLSGRPSQVIAYFDDKDELGAVMPVYFE